MTSIGQRLRRSAQDFPDPDTAWLDALVLFENAIGRSRVWLLGALRDPETVVPDAVWQRFLADAERRAAGRPVAYLIGHKEFWGLEFLVDERVLIPRPDTETLVQEALRCIEVLAASSAPKPIRVHDCCTGSGCVAVAVAHECAALGWSVEVSASDFSTDALHVADQNARRLLGHPLSLWRADLLESFDRHADGAENSADRRFHIITANPPYLSAEETDCALAHGWGEPASALAAAEGGTALLTRLASGTLGRLEPHGYLLVECADNQTVGLADAMVQAGFDSVRTALDLAGRARVVIGRSPAH